MSAIVFLQKSLGNNCKSTCTFDICQGAETDVLNSPGEIVHGDKTNQGVESLNDPSLASDYNPECSSASDNSSMDTVQLARKRKWACLKEIYTTQCGLLYPLNLLEYSSSDDDTWSDDYYFDVQMGDMTTDIGTANKEETQENVSFLDQHEDHTSEVKSVIDPTRKLSDMNNTQLNDFFSRPIKIATYKWEMGTLLNEEFNPWSLYFENKRVSNRISNYHLLRSNLRIKFTLNGCGFHYGRAIASYLPLFSHDQLSLTNYLDEDVTQASQLPHVYLDPTTSQGGEILAPFYFYKNALTIPNSQWEEMGQVNLRSINLLKHANAGLDNVTISVFAWAEDIDYSVLTTTEPDTMVPQMGEIDEANAKGFISGPATAVAKIASAFKGVPQIAPFATATEIAARTTAALAKQMGYSRPPITKCPEPFTAIGISSLALTTVPETTLKLTVDDKQELSVDPRIAGLGGDDPMNIKSIAQKETYLTKFSWPITGVSEDLLWNTAVSPVTWTKSANAFHFPACAFAALPFRHWSGSMKFRFQVVASAYHKGRIKIVFDPIRVASPEYNVAYTQIVDIADETDFTIEVGSAQTVTLIDHHYPGQDLVTKVHKSDAALLNTKGNGILALYVMNELTSPNSTVNNDIEINVFVSAGEDFEVYEPDSWFQNFVFKPQMGVLNNLLNSNTSEPSAPAHNQTYRLGVGNTHSDLVNKVYTGERIESFRSMLKRYNNHCILTNVTTTSTRSLAGSRMNFPYLRGKIGNTLHSTAGATGYNYANTVLLHWVTGAFQGWRGGIRYKLLPRGYMDSNNMMSTYIEKGMIGEDCYRDKYILSPNVKSDSERAYGGVINNDIDGPSLDVMPTGTRGALFSPGTLNPNVEFEVPFYSRYRFVPGKPYDLTSGVSQWTAPWNYRISGEFLHTTEIDCWVSAGEDFQVYFFTGIPKMFYENAPPLPG